jgi:hypothetical protein
MSSIEVVGESHGVGVVGRSKRRRRGGDDKIIPDSTMGRWSNGRWVDSGEVGDDGGRCLNGLWARSGSPRPQLRQSGMNVCGSTCVCEVRQ